jgi:hypothetical protein
MAYKLNRHREGNLAMYKIIGGDQKEYGPVTTEQLRQWIAEGRVNGQTLVQAEGVAEWKPLSAMPEFADTLGGFIASAPPLAPVNPQTWSAQILGRQPEVQIGDCLSRSWKLMTDNFGLLFGATFLIWLIGALCGLNGISALIYAVVRGVFYGGLYLVFLKRARAEPAAIGDAFAGFGQNFAQLLLAGLLTALLSRIGLVCCLVLPGIYLMVAWAFSVPLVADKRLEFWSAMELSRKVVTRVWFGMFGLLVLAFLPYILSHLVLGAVFYSTAGPAIQNLMSSGQPDFQHLAQIIAQIPRPGMLVMKLPEIVLFLNLPFALGALMYAYEDLFGARSAPAS